MTEHAGLAVLLVLVTIVSVLVGVAHIEQRDRRVDTDRVVAAICRHDPDPAACQRYALGGGR